jgi:hypothetical protein
MPVAARETKSPAETALHGMPAGGVVYGIAVACEQSALIHDGSCLVSPGQVSGLRVLRDAPGVIARVVEQPRVRDDRADLFVGRETMETKVFGRATLLVMSWIGIYRNSACPVSWSTSMSSRSSARTVELTGPCTLC